MTIPFFIFGGVWRLIFLCGGFEMPPVGKLANSLRRVVGIGDSLCPKPLAPEKWGFCEFNAH
jgi:hypothetical protein